MAESYYGFRVLFLLLIVAGNGFFAAAEVSLLSVRPSRLRQLAEEGRAGAQSALDLLANPERLLSVTQIGVTFASLGLGWAGEETLYSLMIGWLAPVLTPASTGLLRGVSFVVAFLLMTYRHVVVGEVVPKNLAIDKADGLAIAVAPALQIFYRILYPFVWIIERSSAAVTAGMRTRGGHRGGGHSAEELKLIVSSSRGLGKLAELQGEMIYRVLELDSISVREIMVPRNGIVSIPLEATLEQVLATMIEQQHSRLPVYDKSPERLIGILHYKDLLPVWQERRAAIRTGRTPRPFQVRRMLRKHLVVPETKPVTQLLGEFQQGRSHMAMVVDEFGTITGLVTVEDILEQIVGAIADEYDEKVEARSPESDLVEMEGATKIRDLEQQYGIEIPADGGFETLAGFLLMKLGSIPRGGEAVEFDGRRYTVLGMDRNRIVKVRVEKIDAGH